MSKADKRKFKQYDEDYDYGERLHREKTKKIKRGKNKYYDEYASQEMPRYDKPVKALRKSNSHY